MAKKRLNKKVALVGLVLFIVFAVIGLWAIPHFLGGPEKFIEDGDAAVKAANETEDEQIKAEHYQVAARNYSMARDRAKTDVLRIEILFKLADVYLKTGGWNNARGCWHGIISIDPANVKARLAQLNYFYVMADSGAPVMSSSVARQVWQEVVSQASDFIEAVDANMLTEDIEPYLITDIEYQILNTTKLGSYLYLLKGRAMLEITTMGAVTDPDESLARIVGDLQKVRELEPANINSYWYLAQAALAKGRILASRGNSEELQKGAEKAKTLLEQAVEAAGTDPRAHINLLSIKLMIARTGSTDQRMEQIRLLEPEYLALVQKFDSIAEAYSTLAGFYRFLGHKYLDKAISAIETAVELDKENVSYAIYAADLYYRSSSIYGQQPQFYKAIEIAGNALTLPGVQESIGPRQGVNRVNRIILYTFLANCYIQQILDYRYAGTETDTQTQKWLTEAEQMVHEIEQLYGSGQNVQVIKWRGMLELARGDKKSAVRNLYNAYEQLKASERPDAQLCYALAKVFENTSEVGAVTQFLAEALSAGIDSSKPEARLDYVETLFKLGMWQYAISDDRNPFNLNAYERDFGQSQRSRNLHITGLISRNMLDQAEEELKQMRPDDPNTIRLKFALTRAAVKQLQTAIERSQMEQTLPAVFRGTSTTQGKTGEQDEQSDQVPLAAQAQPALQQMEAELKSYWAVLGELVEKLLPEEPNNIRLLFYKQLLSEPEPDKVSKQRQMEIEENILSGIDDPFSRAIELGVFYRKNNQLAKAAEEFKKVFSLERAPDSSDVSQSPATDTQYKIAAGYLFDLSLLDGPTKDWQLAEQIVQLAKRENLDDCQGDLLAARLAMAKKQYEDALARLEQCLRQKPVFSQGFLLKSRVNAALGNERASIDDARKAMSLNPLNGRIAKALATVLYRRDRELAEKVTSQQMIETRAALDRAVAANPGDTALLSSYAEYIAEAEPLRALAIRQSLQKNAPSMQNALLLGIMATKMAVKENNAERKEALFDFAGSAFEQAQRYDPSDRAMLSNYSAYLRATGRGEKAEQLIQQSQDDKLLWRHYFRTGRFADAAEVLDRLYQANHSDTNALKGLLLVAERAGDKDAVKKYSEELLLLEDNIENRLFQIQTFLKVWLVEEVQHKLQSFKERHPDEPRALMFEAWLTMRLGQLKKALDLANRSLSSNQNDPMAWRLRGEINLLMANYVQAISDIKDSQSRSSSDEPGTRLLLAKAYLRSGRQTEAIAELKRTIDYPQAPAEARELLEQIYMQLGRKKALKRFYDETLNKFPGNVVWYNRAGAFAIAEGDLETAERLYAKAWHISQASRAEGNTQGNKKRFGIHTEALNGYLKVFLLAAGRPDAKNGLSNPEKLDKLFEEAQKYVDGDFAPIAFVKMAEANLKLEDRQTAVKYCRKALIKAFAQENEDFASDILKTITSLLGNEEVLNFCRERVQDEPHSLAANLTMFNLMKIDGRYNDALVYIDKCLEIIEPLSEMSLRKVDYTVKKAIVLQLAYNKTSDNNYLERAITEYESLLDKMPNNIGVLNNLAYMLAENNERLDEALKYAERAHKAMPNNPSLLDTYAYVLYKNDRYSQADELLQAAIQQYQQTETFAPWDVYEHLGMIKEQLGSKDEALEAYKQALEMAAEQLSPKAEQRINSAIERLRTQRDN